MIHLNTKPGTTWGFIHPNATFCWKRSQHWLKSITLDSSYTFPGTISEDCTSFLIGTQTQSRFFNKLFLSIQCLPIHTNILAWLISKQVNRKKPVKVFLKQFRLIQITAGQCWHGLRLLRRKNRRGHNLA